ncbi:nadh kinase pos5 [Ophiostoma piceae UAMH 11346]|uniref:Nadh kinase pos5 n=1 Tax=Ophiostoma piceae (strain UAMH 11346) TaxID=1262450 RepID=S3C9F5_OPHP1|nr:nadh kinase pos5 [Ophiostoma piceae UAMH 11346]
MPARSVWRLARPVVGQASLSRQLPLQIGISRFFSTSPARRELLDASSLPERTVPRYEQTPGSSLLSLHWPQPPRNVLVMIKLHAPHVMQSAIAFCTHLAKNYPDLNLVFEPRIANMIHESLPVPVYTTLNTTDARYQPAAIFPSKVDVVTTLGGDGTILRAASLFSLHSSVPPILSFSMGSLGFLGEWKFEEYKSAWREVYMSGSGVAVDDLVGPHTQVASGGRANSSGNRLTTAASLATTAALTDKGGGSKTGDGTPVSWGSVRGQSMGAERVSRMLLRHRLKVGVYDRNGVNINDQFVAPGLADAMNACTSPDCANAPDALANANASSPAIAAAGAASPSTAPAFHAINELLIHRGPHPHLAIIDIYLNNHFLTEAVADGILVSTPTGSTAYSLSAGGAIIHPLVSALQITPICARSLSFRPLVLPLNTQVVLRLSEKNRGRELEVSIDGKRKTGVGVGIGMEVRVEGEYVGPALNSNGDSSDSRNWQGGVPCVIRAPKKSGGQRSSGVLEDDDGWVGGLNGLLKFNYPFGDE